MNAREAALKMVEEYGGFAKLERELGKPHNYFKHLRYDQMSINADNLASIARACGYTLLLRKDDGSDIVISG